MGYSQEHIERTRAAIIEQAGAQLRASGFDGASIGSIMQAAGLTHGGFYAHFKNKRALFDAVVAEDFDFTRQLAALADASGGDERDLAQALTAYLDPARADHIAAACTMASSVVDVARGSTAARRGFTASFGRLVEAFKMRLSGRREPVRTELALASIAMAVGALTLARAVNDDELKARLLSSARKQMPVLK